METTRVEAESAIDCGETTVTQISDDSLSGQAAITPEDGPVNYRLDVDTSGQFTLSFYAQAAKDTANWTLAVDGEPIPLSAIELAGRETGEWRTLTTDTFYLSDGEQTLQLRFETPPAALDYFELSYSEPTTLDAHDTVLNMGVGINLGNTLDAYPNEGDWAPKAELSYFEAFKEAGFHHVRVPATWDNHTAEAPPYRVDEARMNRTEQVVDWALAQGYPVILNAHHETWLKENYEDANARARFDAIWTQIAQRFAHKSPRLLFEMLNEPVGMTAEQVNDLNSRILAIIREHNPTRLVVIAGNDYTPASSLNDIELPDDNYLIGNFHSYDPWPFAGECTRRWGSDSDKAELAAIYDTANDWSIQAGVPVMVNEFGAPHYDYNNPKNVCNPSDRLAYLRTHVNLAIEHGMAATAWDDAGAFQIYDRGQDSWDAAKDVLVAPNP
ncbi:cellulase family glycosylhydrolase [Marinimicrobium agarilyticum]|uniref:cellulase family glycosylhydrolase n=1 Tax=Marinimicrobium agarilyticum TaxID=306546 RepID=UPI00042439DE|nr:cellulase family glycosylhydrolase [Marinimicrobium agarilyticum]